MYNFLIVWNQGTFRILPSIAFETVTSHWDESQKASSRDNFLYFQLFQIHVNAEIDLGINFPAGIYLLKVNNRNTRARC